MEEFTVSSIYPQDQRGQAQVDALLMQEGIRRDGNLEYTCGIYDEDYNLIATGSSFANTLRCMAVSHLHQGLGLMNLIVGHLIEQQVMRGNGHIFLYTKCDSAKFFGDLGFYEIVRIEGEIVFMENRRTGFSQYLKALEAQKKEGQSVAAVVMNANPFTLGHQYLVEHVAQAHDIVHLFVVSEESSLVPFLVRKRLVLQGTAHLPNVFCHDSGPYIISSATFPSYFQKDADSVIHSHAQLDLAVFLQIAKAMNITVRYVGDEPTSVVTGIYNQVMATSLPAHGIDCVIIPRKEMEGSPISASHVRIAIQQGNWAQLQALVPPTTYAYFASEDSASVVRRIQQQANVVHH